MTGTIRRLIAGLVVALPLALLAPSVAGATSMNATWTNPSPADSATSMTIEIGSGPGPGSPTNYQPVSGSPFAPTITALPTDIPNIVAGTRYCLRWIRKTATISGDPFEMCGTSDMKPGQIGGATIIFKPGP